ncbi:DUF3221 domain-containing protein [Rossellomorea marisflavi]|uniref:DUF3221 domain-containing protein n=2 Tax=Rossellomorea marisflavi TaxID=189381 RepID=UPI002853091A|nr:DUF3221 domain-containing protein [Rossellomorea marisflavi]MDR4938350.1 DUF3221 domain-containing protein [Rossellomorea marisflavi]
MNRVYILLTALLFFILLFYAGELSQKAKINHGAMTMQGMLVMGNGQIYLVGDDDVSKEEVESVSINEVIGRYGSVAKLDIQNHSFFKRLQTGDRVKIWYTEVQESFPSKIQVLKLEAL